MTDNQLLERIVTNQNILSGKPVIRGTRLSVEYILNLLAHGATTEDILEEYEGLSSEDIQACFLFASKSLFNSRFITLLVEFA
ncbi:hypothetical protein RIVM261_062930 [Rivularia sp. IAM M-261]|nr:hypothetical protein CAL7716_049150 [Calothrix sp. PCC 7716]GJD21337.1 hypothetical protein RIVM261_062930 [Rivularia sp. IAM M-261]